MSQLPNLEAAWWASAIGAVMSIGYSAIAIALGAAEAHNGLGSLAGKPAPPSDKMFGCFNALGNFGFAYSCAIVLMEVQVRCREDRLTHSQKNPRLNGELGFAATMI
jgi:hypothetical protein